MSAPYLIMGVSGCGKTSVGQALASALHCPFFDADDFHPAANRDKMSRGIPLTEEDRAPWLQAIAEKLIDQKDQPFVLACSALRESYRQLLRTACPALRIIHLHGTRELLLDRLQQRENHFMPASLLDSQLATLETPVDALTIDISLPMASIVQHIVSTFSSTSHV